MPSTPTEEGSIVAYLRLNDSDWKAKLDEAEARARELGRLDPTVRVNADTAEALAKLEAVRVAAERVGGGTVTTGGMRVAPGSSVASGAAGKVDALAASTGRLAAMERQLAAAERAAKDSASSAYIANLRLAEVQDKRGRTELQVAAATEASARADRRAAADEARHILLTKELTAAQRKVAESALAQGAAQDVAAAGNKKAAASAAPAGAAMGVMVAAAIALIPLLAPLAAYVSAVGGAFLGMGAAGILAVLGIKNAMAAGTQQGAAFSLGMQTLKSDLSGLENAAAAGMLNAFNTAIQRINGAMPQLNSEIRQFSSRLGTVGNTVLSALINGFQILNPLFRSAGQYVQGLAGGFLSWTTNGGLQQFATYAMSVLPQVEHTLASVARAVMHILEALAPLGVVGLAIVQGLADTINALPTGVLLDLAAAATAGFAAFKLWGILAPLIQNVTGAVVLLAGAESVAGVAATGFGVALKAALGPIGLVFGVVGALAGGLLALSTAQNMATQSVNDYNTALKQDNGVIGENVRAQAAKALVDAGAVSAAKALGLSAAMVTDAALGQAPAMRAVNEAVKAATAEYTKAVAGQGQYGEVSSKTLWADKNKADAAKTLKAAVDAQNAAVQNAITNGIDYNAAMNLGGSVAQTMASNLGLTIDAYNALVTAQNNATAASKTWKSEMDILNGAQLGYAAAQNQFDSLIANAPKVTSKTTGGVSASQIAAAQNSAASATASHANAVTALGIAQTRYNNAVAKNNAQPTAAHALSVRSAQLALSRAQSTVASTAGSASAAQGRLTAAQQKGTTTVTSGTSAVYGSTAAAVANRSALVSQINAAEAASTAFRNQGGAAEDARKKLVDMKAEIIKNAIANGENADQVQKYVDNLFKIQPKVFSVADFNASQATAAMEAYKNGLKLIPMTVFTNIEALISAAPAGAPVAGAARQGRAFFAGGGLVSQYKAAGGPIEAAYLASGGNPFAPQGTDTVPAMLTPGEDVTSNAHGQASKWRSLLKLINQDAPGPSIAAMAVRMGAPSLRVPRSTPSPALVTRPGHTDGNVTVQVINKSGAVLGDLIEMHIVRNNSKMAVELSGGLAY